MYLPWPRSAIMLLPSCKEQVDASGRLVFRGPRIKMGVCEYQGVSGPGVSQKVTEVFKGNKNFLPH